MYKEIMLEVVNKLDGDIRMEIHEEVGDKKYGMSYGSPLPKFEDFSEDESKIAILFILRRKKLQGENMSEIHTFIKERIIKE